jgi:hypothetical protein
VNGIKASRFPKRPKKESIKKWEEPAGSSPKYATSKKRAEFNLKPGLSGGRRARGRGENPAARQTQRERHQRQINKEMKNHRY